MKRTWFAIPILLLTISCKSRDQSPTPNTAYCPPARFSIVLDSTFQSITKEEHGHGHPRDLSTHYKFTPDSLNRLLTRMKSFDVAGNPPCHTGRGQGMHIQSWQYTLPEEQTPTLLRKIFFEADIPHLESGGSIHFEIIDYEIFRFSAPKHILLRIVPKNGFEGLQIDDQRIVCDQESRLVGLDDAISLFDYLKTNP